MVVEVNRQGEVWVFAEQEDGTLHDVSLELCGKARQLADQLGVKVGVVLPGNGVEPLAATLISHGADNVYVVDDPILDHYQTGTYSHVLCTLIEKHRPQIVIYGATPLGRDLAPRVASKIRAGMTADCTDLEIEDVTDPKTDTLHKNLMLQIRPAFGGNIVATIVNYDWWPQMATVREGVMQLMPADPTLKGEIVREAVTLDPALAAIRLIERHTEERTINLKASRVIVAGGGGIGSRENFQILHELAGVVGGVVGASRAAVDGGLIGKDHQVGQTGTTVRPVLYIAIGISGAIQHRAGMEESAKIIAINTDPDAPIFSIAHYGVVGDFQEIVPMMIKAIRSKG